MRPVRPAYLVDARLLNALTRFLFYLFAPSDVLLDALRRIWSWLLGSIRTLKPPDFVTSVLRLGQP